MNSAYSRMPDQPLLAKNNTGENGTTLKADPSWTGLKNHDRKCQDILFVLLFIGCVFAFVVICSEGFARGNPSTLIKSANEIPATSREELKARMRTDFAKAVGQMKSQWRVMLGTLALATFLAFVWVQLLRLFTKPFIYMTIFLGIGLLVAVSIYMLQLGVDQKNKFLKIVGGCGLGVAVILLLVTIALRKKIALTAVIMKETCGGLEHNPSLLVLAVVLLVLFLLFCLFWIYSLLYVYTVPNNALRRGLYFNVFMFFWIAGVISGVYQMTVAGGMAGWYFSRGPNADQSFSPAIASFVRALTLSLGSIAFGTLIVAVVAFVNFLLSQSRRKTENKFVRYIISCIQCCLGSIQALVAYLNKFAFVYTAMYGESYCASAKAVHQLMSRNGLSIIIIDSIAGFLLFVGKIFGTAATVLVALIILDKQNRDISPLTVVIIVVIAFLVFHIFAHILGMGVDATFVCYVEDLERHGVNGRLYASAETHDALQAHHLKVTSEGTN